MIRVVNVITKFALGGAQQTALRSCAALDGGRFTATLVSGPDRDDEGDLAEEARELGVPVTVVPSLHRPLRPVADARAVADLAALFRREQPDVVHTHSSKAGIVGRLAARRAGVPVVVHTVHGWSFHPGQPLATRALYRRAERTAAHWTSAFVVVGERDRAIGLAAGIGRPDDYHLVRSAVDLREWRTTPGARERARRALGAKAHDPVIGTVTRLADQKDPATFVRAVARVLQVEPAAVVAVIGDGPLRPEVEDDLRRRGIAGRVRLLGARHDVRHLVPAFDVFLFTSRWEGLPRTVVEAMAAGIPVVATDTGAVGEVVLDGDTGVLAAPGDDAALAHGVRRVLRDGALASRLTAAASQRISEFDVPAMARALTALYEGLVERSEPRRRRMALAAPTASGHEPA